MSEKFNSREAGINTFNSIINQKQSELDRLYIEGLRMLTENKITEVTYESNKN